MIPGANVLNMALSIIAKQTVTYYQELERTLNDVGQDITQYAPGFLITGSFQPVPRRLYQIYGLDLQKSYFTLYTSNDVIDVARDLSGDQIAFDGKRYQCESNNDWYRIDGWKGILCVLIGDDVGDQMLFGFNAVPSLNAYVNYNNGNFIDEPGV